MGMNVTERYIKLEFAFMGPPLSGNALNAVAKYGT